MSDEPISPRVLWKIIPVTKGCDYVFTIQKRNEEGAIVDWGEVDQVAVDIDVDPPVRVEAVIDGPDAMIVIPDALCDQVTRRTAWRAVLSRGDIQTPLMVGGFKRDDGGVYRD